jgi:3-hydroxybutyryl-CoA dehydrogenase
LLKVDDIKNISLIGAGLMGSGLAIVFASKGYNVRILDLNKDLLEKSIINIRETLNMMSKEGISFQDNTEAILGRVKTTTEMEIAIENAQFIIEAVSENLPLKQEIFKKLDSTCPSYTILATNTSVISISEIASKSVNQGRIVGTHFWNPPYMIPLVEVIKGNNSSAEAIDLTFELMKKTGKHPVKVLKDVPGFIGNRLQHALWREAISIVEHGIADAASVDDVIKKGFGIRLPVLGPLENADMVGVDLALSIHQYILKHLEASPNASPLLEELVKKGDLGFKTGEGFYHWSPDKIKESREKLLKYLIDVTKRSEP